MRHLSVEYCLKAIKKKTWEKERFESMHLLFEISALAELTATVRLYQVKVDGFAWLSQCNCPYTTGLTFLLKRNGKKACGQALEA